MLTSLRLPGRDHDNRAPPGLGLRRHPRRPARARLRQPRLRASAAGRPHLRRTLAPLPRLPTHTARSCRCSRRSAPPGTPATNCCSPPPSRRSRQARSALLFCAAPVLAAALAGPLLGDRLHRRGWIGLAIAVAGVAISEGGPPPAHRWRAGPGRRLRVRALACAPEARVARNVGVRGHGLGDLVRRRPRAPVR